MILSYWVQVTYSGAISLFNFTSGTVKRKHPTGLGATTSEAIWTAASGRASKIINKTSGFLVWFTWPADKLSITKKRSVIPNIFGFLWVMQKKQRVESRNIHRLQGICSFANNPTNHGLWNKGKCRIKRFYTRFKYCYSNHNLMAFHKLYSGVKSMSSCLNLVLILPYHISSNIWIYEKNLLNCSGVNHLLIQKQITNRHLKSMNPESTGSRVNMAIKKPSQDAKNLRFCKNNQKIKHFS